MGRPPRIHHDQILEAARAVFAERGFDAATLADIGKKLGVSAAAILRHFPSKQELFTASMASRALQFPPALDELRNIDPATDPRIVLRRFAEQLVPFIQHALGPSIAVSMHMRARQTTVVVPFDTANEESPARRGLRVVADYFRRAAEAGVIRTKDPRATALLYISHLQSYVFMHNVLNVTPVYPLENYLDALIDLWVHGAIQTQTSGGTRARKETKPAQTRRAAAAAGGGRNGGRDLPARGAKAETARPVRDARSKDGERRVAGRRPRAKRPRR
ncbi:MAG TPA: helix-turn-helix domain-containing protein [Thermoanaerobaculia bacterium]|nr:helix-turn-helix domain-containing protein [Thermoanaerobaculia bacterium]